MVTLLFPSKGIVFGNGSLEHLKTLDFKKGFIVTGGSSMKRYGIIDKALEYLNGPGRTITVYSGVGKNPTTKDVLKGLEEMKAAKPDLVVAIGGGSVMDCAKCMTLFYDYPEINFDNLLTTTLPSKRKTVFVAVPSTSGTGSEVTHVTVITNTETDFKFAVKSPILRPDVAILDGSLAMTMPPNITAETGMDALTHAIECYTHNSLDDFDEILAKGAIEGILKWLPVSYEKADLESREKMHLYQSVAGIAFANVGLGMCHGISHAFGGIYDYAHGLTNGVIIPYVLDYNKRSPVVKAKLDYLSKLLGCNDIIDEIKQLKVKVKVPHCIKEIGLDEADFKKDFNLILEYSMKGATTVNPVLMTPAAMTKMLEAVYYGKEIDF